ncbi:hypothetical protein EJ04DRAFT_7170 [Polyplosphaeria fusca]|uniref:F-box domain-containing protein n=1 Tax=Polyplosphaeria fusca TaxID=682080 RepID=A0A9P4V739_9PLEO|nr:hypothetical protein EJ04DRAFT_7170 [Polyplosphaeria fusca]
MDSDIFCVLCGNPFGLEPGVYNIDPDRKDYQWIYNVRLLATPAAMQASCMVKGTSDVRNYSGNDDVFMSSITYWQYTPSELFPLGDSLFQGFQDRGGAGDVIFPLHNACVHIAGMVIQSQLPSCSSSASLTHLYKILRHKYQHRKSLGGGVTNDLFDLQIESPRFGPRGLLALEDLDWWGGAYEKFLTDPMRVPDLTSFLFNAIQDSPKVCWINMLPALPERSLHGLECLPNEMLDNIVAKLPPSSTVSLHRTSRSLAHRIRLDERFWRDNLLDGSLLPHIQGLIPIDERKKWRRGNQQSGSCMDLQWGWRRVSKLLHEDIEFPEIYGDPRLEGMPDGFWNRCRIWKIIEEASREFQHNPGVKHDQKS